MGLNIGDIIPRTSISFPDLKKKVIAVDASNVIYQFLSTIRQPDGTPLMDKKRRVTSHLSGLFYRNIKLLEEGLKLVYVFDGEPPKLKYKTALSRHKTKELAKEKYKQAKQKENIENMGKYAKQMTRFTKDMAEESKQLLKAMGIAVIQAPGEAEAQAAHIAKTDKQVYAVASQDYDNLLFGAPNLIQNLTLARKRRTVSGWIYISPELIELNKVLNTLQINMDQLISLGILCGTDYNPGGIKGIGQKKALDLVKKLKYPVKIFDSLKTQIENQAAEGKDFNWQEIFQLFHKPKVKDMEINFPKLNEEKIKKILTEHDFSESRIQSALDRLNQAKKQAEQRTLF